jgi:hypothetical protein
LNQRRWEDVPTVGSSPAAAPVKLFPDGTPWKPLAEMTDEERRARVEQFWREQRASTAV